MWEDNKELPLIVKQRIPSHEGKTLWREAVGSALRKGCSEREALTAGWFALRDAGYNKNENDQWVTKAKTFHAPKQARDNAKKALAWREKYPDEIKGGTTIGWTRANQLASNEALTLDTVKRIAQFERHRENSKIDPDLSNTPWKDAGYVAWLLWGGDAGISWAKRVVEQENVTEKARYNLVAEVSKVDEDLRLVSGWASVIEKAGTPVIDTDGDVITSEDLVRAAHNFVLNHREAKRMHKGGEVGQIVDSVVFTKDLQETLGIDLGQVGWFITMKIMDDDVWKDVKGGSLPAFSIGGRARREELRYA